MKILVIAPRSGRSTAGSEGRFTRIPPLNLPLLAALAPEGFEVSVVDESVEPAARETDADVVAITVMTAAAPRAYALADHFRACGKTVLLGGIHPSCLPEEAAEHADAVIRGEAEDSWPQALRDIEAGTLKPIYSSSTLPDLSGLPRARRELLPADRYPPFHVFQASRGCPYDCRFCSVSRLYGRRYRFRPFDEVFAEIEETLRRERPLAWARKYGFYGRKYALYFVDDNIGGCHGRTASLFRGLREFGRYWVAAASLDLAEDEDLVALAAESGCIWISVGFESLSQETLKRMSKLPNRVENYRRAIELFHRHGILVVGSFIVGNDEDTVDVFPQIERFARTAGLDLVFPLISTPLPGSQLAGDLNEEGRILTRDWSLYDCSHVVFRPKQMTAQQLLRGHRWLWKRLYSCASIGQRLNRSRARPPFSIVANMGMGFVSHAVFAAGR